ncbi:TonB-dependent siderophore receptor [Frateuria aurantia]
MSSIPRSQRAVALNGEWTAVQAVQHLLVDSAWTAVEEKGGIIRLQPRAGSLQRVDVTAKLDEAETSFKADRSDTVNRSDTDLMDIPGSETIITSKVMQTQQNLTLDDSLLNASGLVVQDNVQGTPSFSIRGFGQTGATVNGISDPTASSANINTVERVEVLKGPEAILSGQGSLGGSINVVLKKPQAKTIRTLSVQYGSHGDKTLALDFSGAVSKNKKLTYRLIASAAKAQGSEGGYAGRSNYAVMPEIRWKDRHTDIIVGIDSEYQRNTPSPYTYVNDQGHIMPEPTQRLGRRSDGFGYRQRKAFFTLEETINSHISLVSRVNRVLSDLTMNMWDPMVFLDPAAGDVLLYADNENTATRVTSSDTYLKTNFRTGPIQHKLSVGVNTNNTSSQQVSLDRSDDQGVFGVYSRSPLQFPGNTGFYKYSLYTSKSQQQGLYAQDLMSYGPVNLALAIRRDRYVNDSDVFYPTSQYRSTYDFSPAYATTPSVGVVYNVSAIASVYATWSKGFTPQQNIVDMCGASATVVPPLRTRNRELGSKFSLLDNKLSLTTSVFQTELHNSLLYSQGQNCYTLVSSQRTRGAEFDMQGELATGWNILLNGTYNDIVNTQDPSYFYPAQPRRKSRLWTVYTFQDPRLRGFGIGGGVYAYSQSYGTYTDTYKVPGGARIDLSLYYSRADWSLTLGLKNLANRLLYSPATTTSYLPIMDRRQVMLSYSINL